MSAGAFLLPKIRKVVRSAMAQGKYKAWLEPDNLLRLQAWARNGLTDEQIAHNVGIAVGTLYDWKKKYPEISEALKRGKEVVDIEVENALIKRAKGYDYEEVTRELSEDLKTGENRLVITKVVKKHMAPDVTAIIFWLKNRLPEDWRDKKDIDMQADIKNPFDGISTHDIKKLIRDG